MQGQIVNLLRDLSRPLGLTIVLISHDLAIVARICAAIAVMKEGRIVEAGPTRQVAPRLSTPTRGPCSTRSRTVCKAARTLSAPPTAPAPLRPIRAA